MSFDHEPAGYQVCLCVGAPPAELASARCIDISPIANTEEAVVGALVAAGLEASDLRARTLVSLDCDAATAVLVYSAIIGFAGRRVDALVGETLVEAALLNQAGLSLQSPRPSSLPQVVQVGAAHEGMHSILLDTALAAADASSIRWARRVRFVPDANPAVAISQLLVIAAMRSRTTGDRLPILCDNTEPAPVHGETAEPVGIDLDHVRTTALGVRRSVRSGDRDALAEVVPPSPRRARLAAAGALPIEETLTRLGARHNEGTDLWHCPRPERHTHGDATASMRIQRGRVRCYRCDPERVDSLRLVMDAKGLSVDEAADWLLDASAA